MLDLESRRAYYESRASRNSVGSIKIPLLVVHANDDPLIDNDAIPLEHCLRNSHIILVRTNWGGHIGWGTSSTPFMTASWSELLVLEYLRNQVASLNLKASTKPIADSYFPIFHVGGSSKTKARCRL